MASDASERPSGGIDHLTDKEKQTLRLIVRGHDAKSVARHTGLSVHTINERLRHARRKLSVSSSREAARLLLEREGADPENLGYREMGDAARPLSWHPARTTATSRFVAWSLGGVLAMSAVIAAIMLSSGNPTPAPPADPSRLAPRAETSAEALAQSSAVRAAVAWLGLVDSGQWDASYQAAGKSFRELNAAVTWAQVSQQVRVPLGKVLSRTPASMETVPAPPSGYQMVKFDTRFANGGQVLETLTLAREDGGWRVVGYVLD